MRRKPGTLNTWLVPRRRRMEREIDKVATAIEGPFKELGRKAEVVAQVLGEQVKAADAELDKVLGLSEGLAKATQNLSKLTSALSNFPPADGGQGMTATEIQRRMEGGEG